MGSGTARHDVILEQKTVGEIGQSLLHTRLDSNGDGSGTKNMGTTADEYYHKPASDRVAIIETARIILRQTGDFPWEEFAATGSALSTGCLFKVKQDNQGTLTDIKDLLDDVPITMNADFLHFGEVSTSLSSSTNSILVATLQFRTLLGFPLSLRGDKNILLSFQTQDDLSAVASFELWINGILRKI